MENNKFYYLTIIIFLLVSCQKEKDGFTIKANLKDISNGTLFYLESWDTRKKIDSAYVYNGSLSLEGKLNHPENLFLYATDSLSKEFIYTNLLIGNENIQFNATKQDFPWNINASGSASQDVAEKFNQIEFQRHKIREDLKNTFDGNKKLLSEKLAYLSDSLDNVKVALIKRNINSYSALGQLIQYYKNRFSKEELTNLYSKLNPKFKQSKYGKAIKMLVEFPAPDIGDKYYDYTAINQKGDTFSLSQIKNRYILLHFSSAACFPSQMSLPEQKKLYKQYGSNLEIVKISEDTDKKVWKKSIEKDSIPWFNLWDGKSTFSSAVLKYGVVGTPNYVLISPEKRILEKWFGYEDGIIQAKLKKHLEDNTH